MEIAKKSKKRNSAKKIYETCSIQQKKISRYENFVTAQKKTLKSDWFYTDFAKNAVFSVKHMILSGKNPR